MRMLRIQPIYLAMSILLSHGAFLTLDMEFLWHYSKLSCFSCLAKDEWQEFSGQTYAAPCQGGMRGKNQHTLCRVIIQHLVGDIIEDLKTEQE